MNNKNIKAMLGHLNTDIDASGWDQNSRIFLAKGDPEDPYLEPATEVEGVLSEALPAVFDHVQAHHAAVPSVGLVFVTEIWRLKIPHELLSTPELQEFFDQSPFDTRRKAAMSYFKALQAGIAFTDHAMTDVRLLVFVNHDGEAITLGHDRLTDARDFSGGRVSREQSDKCGCGRDHPPKRSEITKLGISGFMMLNGIRPDAENLNPWQAVEDYRTLRDMEV